MKAYNVNYGTKVKIVDESIKTPPGSVGLKNGDIITIFRVDGMHCNGKDENGNKIYIAAWTNVETI